MVRVDEDRLQEIRYAGLEGPGCDRLPPEGDLEARGNEPFWNVRVDGATALLRTPMEPDGQTFRDGTWIRVGNGAWRYESHRGDQNARESLTLELTEERCADSMSGARFPFRATVIRNNNRMEGCALEGRRARSPAGAR